MPDLSSLTPLLKQASDALLQLLVPAVVSYVGFAVKKFLDKQQNEVKRREATALVKFAAQRIADNQERLTYVVEKLMLKLKVSEDEAHLLAEEAVVDLKNGLSAV